MVLRTLGTMLGPRFSTHLWRHLLGVAVWTLLAAGLVAMHGLGNHGAAAHRDVPQPVSAEFSVQVQAPAPASTETRALGVSEPSNPDSMGELVSMCLTILLGVLAGLAAALGHLERRPLARVARAVRSAVREGRRDRDRPCLVQLSVMRY